MARVFLDTNYFIDIAQRNPGVGKAVDGQEIVISSLSVHILAYINKINIPNVALTRLVNQVQVVDFDKKVLNLALRGPTKDLEDNIQLHSAASSECNFFLTNDKTLLKMKFFGKVQVLNSTAFCQAISEAKL